MKIVVNYLNFVFHIGVEVNCKRKFKGKNQCQRFFFNKLVKALFTKKYKDIFQ